MQNLQYPVALERIAAELIDGDAVIINVATGTYYNTEGSGGWAWERCVEGLSVDEMTMAGCRVFDVSADVLGTDLRAFFQSLKEEDLVSESPAPTALEATPAAETTVDRQPYVAPKLVAYRDLRDLLALDPPMPKQFSSKEKAVATDAPPTR